jgi:hypothetical protein
MRIGTTHAIILSNVIFKICNNKNHFRNGTFLQRQRLSECVIVVYGKLSFAGIHGENNFVIDGMVMTFCFALDQHS